MKASSSRSAQSQLFTGPLKLDKVSDGEPDQKKLQNGDLSSVLSEAGALIEAAREGAGLTRKEACALMFISEGQYSRWVTGASNDTASFPRLLLLPPTFWFHMNQQLNERFGLRRLIAAQLLGSVADLVIASEGR